MLLTDRRRWMLLALALVASACEPEPAAEQARAPVRAAAPDPPSADSERRSPPPVSAAAHPAADPPNDGPPNPDPPKPKSADSIGVAKVLGTYGGPGAGTVFEVIESTDSDLDKLFAEGMSATTQDPESGDADDEATRAYLRGHRTQLRSCAKVLGVNPGANGKLHVTLDVARAGTVTAIAFDEGPALPKFRKCVTAKIDTWRFPKSDLPRELSFAVNLVP